MGMELVVATSSTPSLSALLSRLDAAGLASTVIMVDNALVHPRAAPPVEWHDVRLRTPAGTLTLRRRPDGVAVVVFGNADPALQAAQQRVGELLGSLTPT
jgi:hypothetical protein